MSKEKVKLNQLEIFVMVVETGSFNAAAVEMGCTQSRISHAIGELENNLGTRLLHRSQSGCIPTSVGHSVAAKARQILSLATSVTGMAKEHQDLIGTVRIACFRSVATHILPFVIERLNDELPGIQIEVQDGCLDYEDVTERVEQGKADIGITRGPFSADLVSYPFIRDSYVFVAPPTLKIQPPVTWEQFSTLPFIHAQNAGARWIVDQCRDAGFRQVPARTLVNESGILAMVRRGLGYTIFPQLTIFSESADLKIIPLPIRANRNLSVIANLDSNRAQMTRQVLQYLKDRKILQKTDAYRANAIALEF
ncbi:LysR family transcriptional regulator [uncultured Herbaspirillum sp.]|uniref:LysR family transcriptional regulator n=1 Tax=uncultured Herbaspirillum sp. TaxID=160236 RepID=UPI00258ED210|nr:LysR family transcriptional regulator [uncultured Herbaspirillum sp.]